MLNNRGMSGSKGFSKWVEEHQKLNDGEDGEHEGESSFVDFSSSASFVFGQISSIQENFAGQLQELSGSLPEAGPLSAAFRARVTYSIYLLGGAVVFGVLAVFVGLPTLVLRPAKFVICMALSTICAAGSVIVLQKPSTFLSNLIKGGPTQAAPVVVLFSSLLFTTYVTVFIHRYLAVIFAGGIQILCMLYYLASFVPGGSKGLMVLLKMAYAVLKTALTPCLFVAKKAIGTCFRNLTS